MSAKSSCRRLEGKIAIVAGGSTGIGRITAARLAAEGASVLVGAPISEAEALNLLVSEISSGGGIAASHCFDATDDASVANLVVTAANHFGHVDIVHANFADLRVIHQDSDVLSVSDEVLERTLEVNLKGMFRLTRHALPQLLARGGGAMIYTSSTASITGKPVRPCYAMSKAGLNALVRHVASGWGRQGVRANAILPGFVLTDENRPYLPEGFEQSALREMFSVRLGRPEDVAAMVALLASDEGAWINGQSIAVDGGCTMR